MDRTSSPFELRLPEPVQLSESAEAALEDYAREVACSQEAEAVRAGDAGTPVVAIRLGGLDEPPRPDVQDDVRAFARELAVAGEGARLGWS